MTTSEERIARALEKIVGQLESIKAIFAKANEPEPPKQYNLGAPKKAPLIPEKIFVSDGSIPGDDNLGVIVIKHIWDGQGDYKNFRGVAMERRSNNQMEAHPVTGSFSLESFDLENEVPREHG